MGVISGFQAASFYHPGNGTAVQINAEDLSGEAEFSKEEVEPDRTDPTGGWPYVGHECTLEVPTYAFGGFDQLKTWAESGARISAVVAGAQQNVQWYERDRVRVTQEPAVGALGQTQRYVIRMTRVSPHPAIYQKVNLLDHIGWSDADGDGQADGYRVKADASSFDESVGEEGQQYVGRHDGGETYVQVLTDVVWPLSGLSLELSAFFKRTFPNGDTIPNVRQYSYDGNQIQSDERYIEAGQQRKSFAFVTAPHTFLLKVWPIQGRNFSGPEEAKIVDPALRTDGSGEYANY